MATYISPPRNPTVTVANTMQQRHGFAIASVVVPHGAVTARRHNPYSCAMSVQNYTRCAQHQEQDPHPQASVSDTGGAPEGYENEERALAGGNGHGNGRSDRTYTACELRTDRHAERMTARPCEEVSVPPNADSNGDGCSPHHYQRCNPHQQQHTDPAAMRCEDEGVSDGEGATPQSQMPIMALHDRAERANSQGDRAAPTEPPGDHAQWSPPPAESAPWSTAYDNPIEAFSKLFCGSVVAHACTAAGKRSLKSILHSLSTVAAASADYRVAAGRVINAVVSEICAEVSTIAVDVEGCHVMRAAVAVCNRRQTEAIVSSLTETLIVDMCTTSKYTHHTLRTMFERHCCDLTPVVDTLARNALCLASKEQGCIALMHVYASCSSEHQARLMKPLLQSLHDIALDPYGNYVVQCVIEKSNITAAVSYTVTCLFPHFLTMSRNKYASNVVERIIRRCFDVPHVRRLLLDELVFNPAALQEMVSDQYGNYVIQSIIEHTTSLLDLKRLADRLRPALVCSRYAGQIGSKLKQQQRAQPWHGRGGMAGAATTNTANTTTTTTSTTTTVSTTTTTTTSRSPRSGIRTTAQTGTTSLPTRGTPGGPTRPL